MESNFMPINTFMQKVEIGTTSSGIPPVFSVLRVTRSLVLCVCFVDRCLSFFFWQLCCLFFFDLQILITSLVSLNSSYDTFYGIYFQF